MFKYCVVALALITAPLAAKAGDPCPIPVVIYDLGSPDWLNNAGLLSQLQSKAVWLGVTYSTTDSGLQIMRLFPNSPMEKAGIPIDGLITQVNGLPVLPNALDNIPLNGPLQLTVRHNGQSRDYTVTPTPRDPVPLGIIRALEGQDCRDPQVGIATTTQRNAVLPTMYGENRRFRCEDAHTASPSEDGTVYILRGSRRIIMTMPGWATTCINASDLDGTNFTDANALAIIDRVIAKYVADRFANP